MLPEPGCLRAARIDWLTSGNPAHKIVDNRCCQCCQCCDDFLYYFKGARSAPCTGWRVIPCEVALRRARCRTAHSLGRAQAPTGHSSRPVGSSALAPPAHGGLPPVRYPRHRPSPAGRRHSCQACLHGNGHPPGTPALSRPRSPSRALRPAAFASFGWRSAPLWTVILVRHMIAPVERMDRSGHAPRHKDAGSVSANPTTNGEARSKREARHDRAPSPTATLQRHTNQPTSAPARDLLR